MHNRKKQPWLPESSGEYVRITESYSSFDIERSQRENELRRKNEVVLHPQDGFYRDEDGFLRKVTNGPYVTGRQWARLQRRDYW